MKILFVAANPAQLPALSLDEEIGKIEHEILSSSYRDIISFKPVVAARIADLIRALNKEKPDILHFSGHGDDDGGLIFLDDSGAPLPVDPVLLAELLATLEYPLKLVVLNSCFSFAHASAIVSVVDVVIGVPGTIADADAITFSGQLYGSLADGVSIESSYRQGYIGVQLINKNAWQPTGPLIMNRSGTSPSSVSLVRMAESRNPLSVQGAPARQFTDRHAGRKFLMESLTEFCKNRKKLAITFLDIEGMKSINERFERKVGDRVITETLMLVLDKCGAAIAAGICGDDTFFCIYESDDRSSVIRAVRQLIVDIESYEWAKVAWSLWVRVEGGFAIWRRGEETPIDVLLRAGVGLRQAQNERRTVSEGTDEALAPFAR